MEKTEIAWTATIVGDRSIPGATFNPWIGCTHKSAGCANCYAETLMDDRYGRVKWGSGQERSRTSDDYWKQPFKWNKRAERTGTRTKVFCASLADWLDHEVPIEWLADLLILIHKTPHLDWLLLTKRIEQFNDRIYSVVNRTHDEADEIASNWFSGSAPENVWLGVSVENQKAADDLIPLLFKTPAAIRFLSCEPLLGDVNLAPYFVNVRQQQNMETGEQRTVDLDDCLIPEDTRLVNYNCTDPSRRKPIDWVIAGGESGSNARTFDLEWARSLRKQCQDADVAYFFKQAGCNAIDSSASPDRLKLRDKKGGNLDEMPAELQVREFPEKRITANV